MVRFCVINGCKQSDTTILAHRFPKNVQSRIKWQQALNLESHDLEVLLQKYVVCTRHFQKSDYRNAISTSLNSTAVPSLEFWDDETGDVIVEENIKADNYCCQDDNGAKQKRPSYVLNDEVERLKKIAKEVTETQLIQPIIANTNCHVTINNQIHDDGDDDDGEHETIMVQEITFAEVAIQTDDVKFEESVTNAPDELQGLTKHELIQLILQRDNKIQTLESKVRKFESAMSAFKTLMNPGD